MIKMLNLDRQHAAIRDELDDAINSVIMQSEFVGGRRINPFVCKFEHEFARYVGVKHCVGVGSGTDAIRMVIQAVREIGRLEFPTVSIPANTAYPVAEAVFEIPYIFVRFIDCDSVTYTVVPEDVTINCQAAVVCHQYGHPCEMNDIDGILFWTKKIDNVFLIEDCSHAHGAKYWGRNVGTFGDAAVFSFNPAKILGALGDAGCIVTNDDDLAEMCRCLADHGRREKYTHDYIGWNSRMDGIQAAVLSVKLKYLDEWVMRRREIAHHYNNILCDEDIILPFEMPDVFHSYHQYVVRVEDRSIVRAILLDKDIQTGIHYPISLPEQPALAYLNVDSSDLIATELSREILSLPINESMTDAEVETVCETLAEVL